MTKIEALGALLDMAERKVAIYDAVTDPKQRKLLKSQIVAMTWVTGQAVNTGWPKEMIWRLRALERRFPL